MNLNTLLTDWADCYSRISEHHTAPCLQTDIVFACNIFHQSPIRTTYVVPSCLSSVFNSLIILLDTNMCNYTHKHTHTPEFVLDASSLDFHSIISIMFARAYWAVLNLLFFLSVYPNKLWSIANHETMLVSMLYFSMTRMVPIKNRCSLSSSS